MRKHVLVLMTTAAILACGTIVGSAQTPGAQTGAQQSPVTHPSLGGPTMQHQETQTNDDVFPFEDEDDQNQIYVIEPGMMGGSHGVLPLESENGQNGIYLIHPETVGSGMMEGGWHHGWHRGHAMMAPVMARIIFSLMDAPKSGRQPWQEVVLPRGKLMP